MGFEAFFGGTVETVTRLSCCDAFPGAQETDVKSSTVRQQLCDGTQVSPEEEEEEEYVQLHILESSGKEEEGLLLMEEEEEKHQYSVSRV